MKKKRIKLKNQKSDVYKGQREQLKESIGGNRKSIAGETTIIAQSSICCRAHR